MAKKVKRRTVKSAKKTAASPFSNYWNKDNYYLLILGLAMLVIGFYLLSIGPWDSTTSLVFAPIVLIFAYLVIFPLSIFFKKNHLGRNKQSEEPKEKEIAPGKSNG